MKRGWLSFALLMLSQVVLWPSSALADGKWALLIGNADYQNFTDLDNPGADVRDLAAALEELDFNVVRKEDLTLAEMRGAVLDFAIAAKDAETVLFHYAGHGFQVDGVNYLMPVDTILKSDSELRAALSRGLASDAIKLDELGSMDDEKDKIQRQVARDSSMELDAIVDHLEKLAPTRIVILDACRDNPDFRDTATGGQEPLMRQTGFAQYAGTAGTLIVYSTQPGAVALDGEGDNSPFMAAMLNQISVRGIEIREMLTNVRRAVFEETGGRQTPWDHSSLLENFYFHPAPEGFYGVADGRTTSQEDQEPPKVSDGELWASVQSLLDRESYFRYLQAYPKGAHAEEAKTLVRKLDVMHGEPGASDTRLAALDEGMAIAPTRQPNAANEQAPREAETLRIAVVGHEDFVGDRLAYLNDDVMGLPEQLVNAIAGALSASAGIEVVERGNLRYVIDEQRFSDRMSTSYLERTFEQDFGDIRSSGGDRVYVPGHSLDSGQTITYGAGRGARAALAEHVDLLRDFKDLGSSVGADHVLFGRLEKIEARVLHRQLPYSSRITSSEIAGARIRLRLVNVEQATVVAAFSLESEIETAVFESSLQDARSLMFDDLARDAARKVIDILHPPTIVSTEPTLVDRGSTHGIGVGDQFAILRESRTVFDSQGRELGVYKSKVAQAEVVSVDQHFAELSVIEGEAPEQYDVARLDEEARPSRPSSASATGRPEQQLNPSDQRAQGLPRIAVLPVEFSATALRSNLLDIETASAVNEPFGDNIAAGLIRSQRFELLDRFTLDRLFDEQSLSALQAGSLPPDIAELDVADHLVITRITLAEYTKNEVTPDFTDDNELEPSGLQNVNTTPARGYVEGVVRVINVRTGRWTDAQQISVQRDMGAMSTERAQVELAKSFAEETSIELINAIFPIKVAHAQADGTVYVNRGEDGGLSAGEILTVYRPGPEIRDPDTGIVLNNSETLVGQVQLARVGDADSTASILSAVQPIVAGDVLYRQQSNRGRFTGSPAAEQDDAGDDLNLVTPRSDGLAVLALRRVDFAQSGAFELPEADLEPRLKLELTGRFQKTRRFSIVERENLDTLIEELRRNQAIAGAEGNSGQLSQIDYVVMIRLENLYIDTDREETAIVDRVDVVKRAYAEAQIRLVNVRSSEQLTTDSIRFQRRLDKNPDHRKIIGDLLALLSDEIVKTVVNTVYPIKIVGGNDIDGWYVNRGSDGGIDQGSGFNVFRLGEELRDPDTGVSFGREERRIGSVRVAQVDPARSVVETIEGGEFERGDLLRLMPASENGRESGGTNEIIEPKW